jgi:PBSX family phage terminase large subunit
VLQCLTRIIRGEEKDQFGLDVTNADKIRAAELLGKRYRVFDSKTVNEFEKIKNQLQAEELKLKNEKLAAEVKKLKADENIIVSEKPFELPARLIAPAFAPVVIDIEDKAHKEYVLPGGRGSTKSSFFGLEVVNLIKKNPEMHALAVRKVENTLRDSVYNQIKWAIDALGLNDEFIPKLSPLEIEYKPTGQRIYFRGCDDPTKIKSIKPPFGYIGILWLEELDQFAGAEQVRSIEQSAIRGGDDAYIFKSFNPPKTANNWANKYIKIPKENQLLLHSDYRSVPTRWLGKAFIEEAEHLKNVNPVAYEHEYLGIANGNGGNVFDNVEIREITDKEIENFDRYYFGVDWGWYPDKYAFTKMYYNHNQHVLYIVDEYCCNKKSNRETYEVLVNAKGITPNDRLTCDSAEPKSVEDYRSYGLFARGAIKGPGSVNYKMKWLQSLNKIIIDNRRTPECAKEFIDYEYDRDKEGNVITGYPDKDNHCIDSVSYAMEEVWRRKGQ